MRTLTWSSGGGVQSTAIAVLVAQRKLPTPELMVMADTGREQTPVWDYLRDYVNPMLRQTVGREIEIAGHALATVDLYSKSGKLLIPAFTAPSGKLPTYCSTEWKRRVVRRWLRLKGHGPRRPIDTWIGISRDEITRMKDSDVDWQRYTYPLIDLVPTRRVDCIQLVLDAGLPTPPRSSCWMCPFHTRAEWVEMTPSDKAKAILLDEEIRQQDPNVYLHNSRKPLIEVLEMTDGEEVDERDGVCDSGYCFV